MGIDRRQFLGGALLAAAGAVAGSLVTGNWPIFGPDRLPIYGGYAPAGVARGWSDRGRVGAHWHVSTDQPLVALTFDDGPAPQWTPMVLDALDAAGAPATFFLVGER
ncbi:MAG TPA: polysaccharide deacetylase family protein, partial [Micromonospora sp.]